MKAPFAFYARLIKACQRRGRTLEDAEDLVQEGLLRLIEYQQTARVRDAEAFLRRVIANLSINQYHREQIIAFAAESVEELDQSGALVDPRPEPERVISARQLIDEITSTLSGASLRTSAIFIAHRAGYSYLEIAAELGISPRTVKKHISRATSMVSGLVELENGLLHSRRKWRRMRR